MMQKNQQESEKKESQQQQQQKKKRKKKEQPRCFHLLHNTRICHIRADDGPTVLRLLRLSAMFAAPTDTLLLNTGLHYNRGGPHSPRDYLAAVEELARQIQSSVDAYSGPDNVSWSESRLYTGSWRAGGALVPSLRRHVARQIE